MHIRRLELQGFKSFKDKTVIHFDDGITGIVGPNGCGKSNVVDAFFWVMGEQNARHLRGQNMDDLIFSGSDKSPPASFAEVTLTLDMPAEVSGPNAPAGASSHESLATLPTREVAITRKLYRTGESDYFINKNPCRLKDIQELFMDTGVGARGYSIIQQGQIQKIVQAKPEDRRTMIEEVAGIVKYKVRRKESTRKLEGTQQNLLRVTDVINELENQKRQMERQAEKARKYKEWQERLQSIELNFNALKWEDTNNRSIALEAEIEELGTEDLALSTARETAETQISQMRMELAQASKVAEEFQQKWMEAGNRLNNSENDLKYSQKNLEDLKAASIQLEKDSEEEHALIASLKAEHDALAEESATIDEQYYQAEATKEELEAEMGQKKKLVEESERVSENSRKRLFQVSADLEKAKSSADFAQMRMQELEQTFTRLSTEKLERESFVAQASGEKEGASEKVQMAKEEASALREKIQAIASSISESSQNLANLRKEVSRLSSEQGRIKATLNALEDQKRRHESASKGVKALFQEVLPANDSLKGKVDGTLADLLTVEKGMETAVESSLGKYLELVLTKDASAHLALSEALKSGNLGRATFADITKIITQEPSISPTGSAASGILGNLGKYLSANNSSAEITSLINHLTKNIFVVSDSVAAFSLAQENPALTFVTTAGEVFQGGWYMEGGDQSSVSGSYVGRNREIAELEEKLAEIQHTIESVQNNVISTEESLQSLEQEKRQLEQNLRTQQDEVSRLATEEGTLLAKLEEANRSLQKILQEWNRLEQEKSRLEQSEKEARVTIFSLETEKGALELDTEQCVAKIAAARAELETTQQTFMDARVKAANIADQKSTLDTRRRQNQNALDQRKNRIDNMLEQAKKRQEDAEETTLRIATLQEEQEGLRNTLVEAEANYRAAKDRYDILNNDVEEQRSAAQMHSARERAIKDTLLEKRLQHQKVTGDRDLYAQNTLERYGIILAEYTMSPEAMDQIQLLRNSGEEAIQDIQNEVLLLREKIRKLGDVNPAAVEEYEAILDRYNLLSTQKADLEKAMNDLQDTVDRINKVSKERFERAFHEVNNHFKRVFPVIFGGGHAHLTLTNPEDLLETGVDITAQPPGKKAQNINLLSGGEKTLTAISLLFSIFLVKPSPFCLLDEVDAPLDDANIGRFNALLREMSKRSQFIIITHNKRTMELNDKLYGVTMEDAGVSKMVSIMLSASA